MKYFSRENGFALLLSILISAVMLSVGLAVANISFKEIALSSAATDSSRAFYAADAGAECASFWDIRHPSFDYTIFQVPTSVQATDKNIVSDSSNLKCYQKDITLDWDRTEPPTATQAMTKIKFKLDADQNDSSKPCVEVTITKIWTEENGNGLVDPGEIKTTIRSDGLNVCDKANPRRVQRSLEESY